LQKELKEDEREITDLEGTLSKAPSMSLTRDN
jgi:hypothetical protein